MEEVKKRVGVGFGVMIYKDGKVLLGQRHEDPEKASSELHGEGTWTMPGGKLHFGETPEEGAKRELMEETGMTSNSLKLISLTNDMVSDAHYITLGFLCEDFEGSPSVMEPDEITKWDWFSLDNLPSPMYKSSQKVIDHFLSNKIY